MNMVMDRLAFLALMERAILVDLDHIQTKPRPHTREWHFKILRLESHLASIAWEREEIYDGVLLHI